MELVKGAVSTTTVGWYAAISVTDALSLERHPGAPEQFVLDWPQADLVIPWPEGLTALEAVVTWAQRQLEEDHAKDS